MESTSKLVAWIVVGLLVIGGIYYWYSNRSATPAPQSQTATQAQDSNATAATTLPSGADTSDAALNTDAAAMAGQMSAMDSDTAAIDAGLNDKQVAQ